MEVPGLLDELFKFLFTNFFKLGIILIGIKRPDFIKFVLHAVLNVVTLCTHYNLTQQESNRIKRELSIYKYNQQHQQPPPVITNNMWKSIGSIPSPTGKNKDQVAYEPFAQASRLRLNQSQLSGDHSPQFMQQYFTKKRSPEALPHRSHSQKSLEILPMHSPISSLRDVVSPDAKSKAVSISSKVKDEHSIIEGCKQIVNDSIAHEKDSQKAKHEQIHTQLKKIKEDQIKLKKSVQHELHGLKNQMKETQAQILARLNQINAESEVKKKQGLNPEILSKIRQESLRFNERIRDIQNRKEQVKEKYRMKNQK